MTDCTNAIVGGSRTTLIEVAIVEAWMFLLEAIDVGSKMMKISFVEGEWDER